MAKKTPKRIQLDNGDDLVAGDFVSFTFKGEEVIACLLHHEYGLYSSEGTKKSGYRPFIAASDGRIALGIKDLQKLDKNQVVMMLATTMIQPGNEHLALKAKELLDG